MKNQSKKMLIMTSLMCFVLMLFTSLNSYSQIAIEIQVSPSTINLQNQGTWVTIHTDIAYSAVVGATVTLNGVEIERWKSDNQGDFVAKFIIQDIMDLPLILDDYNTLTLKGVTSDERLFSGSAEVMVINVVGNKTQTSN
jgi:hypothetical protein